MFKLLKKMSLWLLPVVLLASGTQAMWIFMGAEVPVARLIANVTPYVKQHPNDAQGYYVLGRAHSLAFAQTDAKVRVTKADAAAMTAPANASAPAKPAKKNSAYTLPTLPGEDSILVGRYQKKVTALKAEERTHLLESIRNYQKATQIAPNEGLYWLGLGWMMEQAANAQPDGGPAPEEITAGASAWRLQAIAAYHHAYELKLTKDLKASYFGPGPDTNISQEAAEGILRLYKGQSLTPAQQQEQKELTANVEKLGHKGLAVTPIIFPMRGAAPLSQLMDAKRTVHFDLAGNGKRQSWPWVTPDTGFLVWDPAHTGRITSGRQLFGSATWWMFWRNGYQALQALDNNHDGWLTGRELEGIAVWRDANSNGVCDKGEVVPLAQLGITAIATQSAGAEQGIPANPNGLRRTNGTFLPTYDWTPKSSGL